MASSPDVPDWLRPAVQAVVLAYQGRGRDENMRAAVLYSLTHMPPGTIWVAPTELLDRIEPENIRPAFPSVKRDPSWLIEALAPNGREYAIDAEMMPGRLMIKATA